jgi:hypothetical protein
VMSGGCFECRGVLKSTGKWERALRSLRRRKGGVEAPAMRPYPFKLSTFLYLTGTFISASSVFLLELGQAKVVRTSKLQNLEESRLTVDRRNRRSLDHLLGVYE